MVEWRAQVMQRAVENCESGTVPTSPVVAHPQPKKERRRSVRIEERTPVGATDALGLGSGGPKRVDVDLNRQECDILIADIHVVDRRTQQDIVTENKFDDSHTETDGSTAITAPPQSSTGSSVALSREEEKHAKRNRRQTQKDHHRQLDRIEASSRAMGREVHAFLISTRELLLAAHALLRKNQKEAAAKAAPAIPTSESWTAQLSPRGDWC